MGKVLIIKGADFSENAIEGIFNPIAWFVNAMDLAAGPDNPEGCALGPESSAGQNIQNTGMHYVSNNDMMWYKLYPDATYNRYCTRQMVSLSNLYNHGYTSLKLTPKVTDSVICAYSNTPEISSTSIFKPTWGYNPNLGQKTIPITANTYIVFMAKADSSAKSSVADYVDIEIE